MCSWAGLSEMLHVVNVVGEKKTTSEQFLKLVVLSVTFMLSHSRLLPILCIF